MSISYLPAIPYWLTGVNQIVGGPFTDAEGNSLANGYLLMELQHDAVASGLAVIPAGISVKVPLDANGYISGTVSGSPVFVWANDVLVPSNTTYIVWAYTSTNQQAWLNSQIQRVLSTPTPYNINNWVPGP